MDPDTRIQTLNGAICTSHNTNTPKKGMNVAILPPTKGK